MDARISQIVRELRQRLRGTYGTRLKRVVVYGSQARGDSDAGSDIDVLVVLSGPVNPADEVARTIDDVAGVSLAHDAVLSCVFVSQDDFEQGDSPLLRNARREGVPL